MERGSEKNILNLFEQDKMLLIAAIMYSGEKGFDEFELVRYREDSDHSHCLSRKEMERVLIGIEMPDYLIESTIENILNYRY